MKNYFAKKAPQKLVLIRYKTKTWFIVYYYYCSGLLLHITVLAAFTVAKKIPKYNRLEMVKQQIANKTWQGQNGHTTCIICVKMERLHAKVQCFQINHKPIKNKYYRLGYLSFPVTEYFFPTNWNEWPYNWVNALEFRR